MANLLPGGVLLGFGLAWCFDTTDGRYRVSAAVLATLGVLLMIRGYRLGVRYDRETLTVRGMFRTRKIQKSTIREITAFPAVRWSSQSGRTMWTPIIAFAELSTVIAPVARRNEQVIE